MAKRFIDTGLFDDEWFSELNQDCKIFWVYYLTKCDHAGLLKNNKRLIEFQTGLKSLDTVIEHFKNRIITVNGLFFCRKFIDFQYPGFPKSKVRQQDSAIQLLIKSGIWDEKNNKFKDLTNSKETLSKEYNNSYEHGTDNDSVIDNETETVNFGKSENLLLVPEMFSIYKKNLPTYLGSIEKDYKPLFSIAKFLCETGNLPGSPDLHRDKILQVWEPITVSISKDNFYKQKPLSTISNQIQGITQKAIYGDTSNSASNGTSGERIKAASEW